MLFRWTALSPLKERICSIWGTSFRYRWLRFGSAVVLLRRPVVFQNFIFVMNFLPHFADAVGLDFAGVDSVERTLVVKCETATFVFVLEEFLTGQHRLPLFLSFFYRPFFVFDLIDSPIILNFSGAGNIRILFLLLLLTSNRNKNIFLFLFGGWFLGVEFTALPWYKIRHFWFLGYIWDNRSRFIPKKTV